LRNHSQSKPTNKSPARRRAIYERKLIVANILYPHVKVQLTGQDGNAYMVLGLVSSALKRAGENKGAADFMAEATAGDYDHLLATAMKYVDVS
jgi:hypothetical protein